MNSISKIDHNPPLGEVGLEAVLRRHVGAGPRPTPDDYARTFKQIAELKVLLRAIYDPARLTSPKVAGEARQEAEAIVYRRWREWGPVLTADDCLAREFFLVFDLLAYLHAEARKSTRPKLAPAKPDPTLTSGTSSGRCSTSTITWKPPATTRISTPAPESSIPQPTGEP